MVSSFGLLPASAHRYREKTEPEQPGKVRLEHDRRQANAHYAPFFHGVSLFFMD